MTQTPTDEQQKILDESSSCVVIAKPGSGKTFTLSLKIRELLTKLPQYKGVIAISFTNKASDELKRRCLAGGVSRKGSFFGTIDSFFLSQIVRTFGTHVFGRPKHELSIVELGEVQELAEIEELVKAGAYSALCDQYLDILKELFLDGQIILETSGFLAVYIFESSFACRRYLKARYSHVIIDEYQDCDYWQDVLFRSLQQSGLIAIAVGDVDQSIYAFANKDSRFLTGLATNSNQFTLYSLSKNHRCHPSIINYSAMLLSLNSSLLDCDETQVFSKRVKGSESDIGKWLSIAIPCMASRFNIADMSKIGVLVSNRRTGGLVHHALTLPHRPIVSTALDDDASLWGALFRKILMVVFSRDRNKYALAEEYLSGDLKGNKVREVMNKLRLLVDAAAEDSKLLCEHLEAFTSIAKVVLPRSVNGQAVDRLSAVLADLKSLRTFTPPQSDEVQLMTLHKSKGLEFDGVFHLDLYKYILPKYKATPDEYVQGLNLHYVGVTRAKTFLVLCTSTIRHNKDGASLSAEESDFISRNGLASMRLRCPY